MKLQPKYFALFSVRRWWIILLLISQLSCNTTEPPDNGGNNGQDTTSHSINWIVDEIGEDGSYLTDVAIINDTTIVAMGAIYLNDSLSNNTDIYSIAIWNGQTWKLKKLFYNNNSIVAPIRGIFALSSNDIYLAAGSVFHWDGVSSTVQLVFSRLNFSDPNATIEKLWGISNSSLYGVGNAGSIVFYNGTWQKLESGTEIALRDIWGSPDGSVIWTAGFDDSYGTVFLRNNGNGFEKVLEITDPGLPHPPDQITHVFKSLWTDKADTVYLGAIGRVYAAPKNTTGYAKENIWWDYQNQTEYPPKTNIIRGTAGNDIFVGGYLQFVQHYNGKSWQRYPEIEGEGTWRSMAVTKSLVIAVGEKFDYPGAARIARGYRFSK